MSFLTRFKKGDVANGKEASSSSSSGLAVFNRSQASTTADSGGDRRAFLHHTPSSASHTSTNAIRLTDSIRSGINGLGGILRLREYSSSDSKVAAARQIVEEAIAAEKAADRALVDARNKVKEATKHVRNLEREALDE
ncbi:hypothetical protein AX17_003982 [Amanita inopinata Kibby_2008]|nr:hypothetical protein AX17_003982 [Amanita inopinata Kibby_2008]